MTNECDGCGKIYDPLTDDNCASGENEYGSVALCGECSDDLATMLEQLKDDADAEGIEWVCSRCHRFITNAPEGACPYCDGGVSPNDPGPGVIDAIVTAVDWDSDLAFYNAEAAAETTECGYCGHDVHRDDAPALDDDAAWDDLADEHDDDCEWVVSRGYRLPETDSALAELEANRVYHDPDTTEGSWQWEMSLRQDATLDDINARFKALYQSRVARGSRDDLDRLTTAYAAALLERTPPAPAPDPDALARIAMIRALYDSRPNRLTAHYIDHTTIGFLVADGDR